MPIFWRDKILLAKIEVTEGTDPTPTGSDAILVKNVSYTPMEGNDLSRELELPYFGDQGTVPVELRATLSFEVELAPSGTAGTAPAWGKLLRACAVAETVDAGVSVTYNPITNNQESVAFYFWHGTTLQKMLGARGTATISMTAQGIPMIAFEFTSLYTAPVDQARATPDYAAWQRPQAVSTTNTPTVTIDSTSLVMRSLAMNLGNEVEPRFLVGSSGILITGKSEQLEMTVEAVDLATFDPYAAAGNQDELAVEIVHGTGAGRITTLAMPRAQMQRPASPAINQNIVEWPLRLKPVPDTGNDQWTLTLT